MPPAWAEKLLVEVAATHKIAVPQLSWRPSQHEKSSGRYYRRKGNISITAGRDEVEARMVVLHEMAHHLAHVRGKAERGHGEAFYFVCWALYLAYNVPLDLAVANEFHYKASAERTLRKMGVKLNARERKAGDYGDACRRLGDLHGQLRKWQKQAKTAKANFVFYRQQVALTSEQVTKCEQTTQRLYAEWKATA